MLVNFQTKIQRKDFNNLCPHPKHTTEIADNNFFQFKIVCDECNYVAIIRGGKITNVRTFMNNLAINVYEGSTTITLLDRKVHKFIPQSLIRDDFDLTTFAATVAKRMVLL